MNNYKIRRSSRAKKIKLVAKPEGIELVLPQFVPEIMGKAFASLHKDWIEKHSKKSKNALPSIPVEDGAAVFFMGEAKFRLQIKETNKKSYYEKRSEDLVIYLKTKNKKEILDLIEKFYREEAKRYLQERTESFSKKLDTSFGRITIRGQSTRWGSCSSKGNLSYNWKIMKEPCDVIDYLVIHELCHRLEMNHSKKFWKLVESLDPDYKIHRKALNGKY